MNRLVRRKLSGLRYRLTRIGRLDRKAGAKTSLCVKSYKNALAIIIDSVIRSSMNII